MSERSSYGGNEYNLPPHTVKRVNLIDLDNTILDTGVYTDKYLLPTLSLYFGDGVVWAGDILPDLREGLENVPSFRPLEYSSLRARSIGMAPPSQKFVTDTIIAMGSDSDGQTSPDFLSDIFTPGALDLIAMLRARVDEYTMYYTTGSKDDQNAKLAVVQRVCQGMYALPGVVIAAEHKATDVLRWYNTETGYFEIPDHIYPGGLNARTACLVDDKEVNVSFNSGAPGAGQLDAYLVRREGMANAGLTLSEVKKDLSGFSSIK